jgi:glycosyltransferase involved in cell wall biosynthesis
MRAVKEMAAVKDLGHRVVLAYEGIGSSASVDKGMFWDNIISIPPSKNKLEFWKKRLFPSPYKSVIKGIVEKEEIDLIHVFSMPDHLAAAAVSCSPVPVVYDVRDLTTGMNKSPFIRTKLTFLNALQGAFRRSIERRLEKYVCENADGIVCVTESMSNKVFELYNVPRDRIEFLESYPLRTSIPEEFAEKKSISGDVHLVYIGNPFFDGSEESVSLITEIANEGLHLHVYPTGGEQRILTVKKTLERNEFVHIHEPKEQRVLFSELCQYDYGLVLYSPNNDKLNRSLTISNKMLEYLACGIPVASTNLEAPRKFLEEHEAGFVFNSCSELAEKAVKLNRSFVINPEDYVMEKHIAKLLRLYDSAVGRACIT